MRAIIAVAVVLVCAPALNAATKKIGPFPLEGSQEVPPSGSPATGEATITFDTVTRAFSLDYQFSGLLGEVTVAHFHAASAGVNGPVIYWLTVAGPDSLSPPLPFGVTTADSSGSGVFPEANFDDLLAGNIYINIHTTYAGAGEIRGQVIPSPAGALPLMSAAALLALRRRRA